MRNFTFKKHFFALLSFSLFFVNTVVGQCPAGQVLSINHVYAAGASFSGNVTSANNATGSDNSTNATISGNGVLTLDMGSVIPNGTSVRVNGVGVGVVISVSSNGNNNSWTSVASNATLDFTFSLPSTSWRYIRISRASGGTNPLSISSIDASVKTLTCVLDTDGDGVQDSFDLDDDNDGILDSVECLGCSIKFANGGFESPVIAANSYSVMSQALVPGWKTTATDGQIEIWSTGFSSVNAAEGNQFVELNANQVSTLYQEFCLNGAGGTVNWSVKHRGRSGVDVARVKMGETVATADEQKIMSDGTSSWGQYSGTYTIPPGRTTLVIAFESVSSVGGGSYGNFLDDVNITINESCADTDGDGKPNSLELDSDNDGCSDANEYYISATADGTDGGMYGTGKPAVDYYGKVIAASYGGNYTNAITATDVKVTTAPSNQTVGACKSATFSIVASAVNALNYNNGTPNYTGGTNASSAFTYQWQANGTNLANGGVYSGVTTATLNISSVSGLNGTKYTVKVKHPNYVCFDGSYDATLTVVPVPSAPIRGTVTQPTCTVATGSVDLSGLPSGNWTVVREPGTVSTTGSGTSTTISGIPAGNTYTFKVTDANGCTSPASANVVINAQPVPPAAPVATAATAVTCGGFTANWNAVPGATSYGIAISTNELFSSNVLPFDGRDLGSNATSYNFTGLSGGDYYYRVWSYNSCGASITSSSVINVKVNSNPAGLSLTGSIICVSPGGNGTITSSTSVIGVNYQLYNSSNAVVQGSKPGTGSALTWSNLTAGTGYYVVSSATTGTPSLTCTTNSNTVAVATTANPAGLVLTGSTICVSPGGNGTITSSTSVIGVNYQLYNSSNAVVQGSKPGTGSALTWSNLTAGTGYYVVSSATTGTPSLTCTTNSNTVAVATTANPAGLVLTGSTICVSPGGNGTITSSASVIGVNYQLYNSSNTAVQGPIAGTGSGLTWSNLAAGTGYYAVSSTGTTPTCTANSNTVDIITNPLPTASITGVLSTCLTTTLNAVTDATSSSYVWYKNNFVISSETSSSFVVNSDGDYKVKVTNTLTGCEETSAVSTVKVSDTEKPVITCPIAISQTADQGQCNAVVTIANPTATDNCSTTFTFTGVRSDALALSAVYPLGVTTIIWTATDASGNVSATCTQTVTITDTEKPVITCPSTVEVSADKDLCTASGVVLGTPTTSDNCTGTITVTNNAPLVFPIGDTTVTWTARDAAGNTETCTQTVTVVGPILPNDDKVSSINGYQGGVAVLDVLGNDMLNCNSVIRSEVVLTLDSTLPSVLTFDTNTGTVVVKPNTPEGTYSFNYKICEVLNSKNCNTATVEVKVIAPTIDAVTETTAAINGYTGGTTPALTSNDKLNGVDVVIGTNPGEVKLTPVTVPTGLTLNADGTVTVAANTAAGNYDVTYKICEVTNPGNCDEVTSVIVVSQPTIDAVTETTAVINGYTGGTTPALTSNDKLNGADVVIGTNPGEVKLTPVTVPTGLILNADGTVTVAPNTPVGNYDVTYKICEVTNPTNCDEVTSVIVVSQPTIDAVAETTASINGYTGGTTPALTSNDKLNGVDVVIGTNPGEVKLTPATLPTGLTLNADGTVTVAANTAAGNYDVTYKICEVTNPGNCDEVTSVIVVSQPTIDAVTETTASINGYTGGTTPALTLNDKLNGAAVVVGTNLGEVKVTPVIVPSGLTLNADGTVTVAANTAAGNYDVTYKICEVTNPTNCDEVTSTIVVGKSIITALTETTDPINGRLGGTTYSLVNNDLLNGVAVVIRNSNGGVILTSVSVPPGLTLNADGTVKVDAGTPIGLYEVEYTICEFLNPTTNCATVKSYVLVTGSAPSAGVLKANDDNGGTIDTNKGEKPNVNVFKNDTYNGLPLDPSTVILTTVVSNPNLILKADGSIEVKDGTPVGDYELTYQICEVLSTDNCSQAKVKVSVENSVDPEPPVSEIVLGNDTAAADGINGSLEFINVLDNDFLNEKPINSLDIIITNISKSPYFEFNSDGTVNVKPNTPGGNYTIAYQVCEKADSSNCSTGMLNVFVEVPEIALVKTAVFNDENGNGVANAGETITYKFVVTNTGNVPLKGVMITDPLVGVKVFGQAIDLDVNESNDTNFTAEYKITQSDINHGSVSNQASVKGSSARGVVVEDISDDASLTDDKPTVLGLTGCVIKVFNAFSPNGDAKNSRFYIQGLECYPNNTVEIYNRWGVLVFDIDRYNNEDRVFTGFSQGRTTISETAGLPVGTYFYIIKYTDSDSNPHELSGYLYLNK